MVRVSARTTKMGYHAECENCDWFKDTGNQPADKIAARRHAERTGHTVVACLERMTYWRPVSSGEGDA